MTGSVENPHAGGGSVLLDIGGDVGALVVHMPASMTGEEVEIHPAGTDLAALREHRHGHHHPHVAVVERPTPEGPRPSLVYPAVRQGDYLLCRTGSTTVAMEAAVSGGGVTEVTWQA